jgi:hypothetical protein
LLKAIIILYFFNPKFFARAAHSIPELILLVYLTHGAQLKQEHAFSGVFTTFTPAVSKTTPPPLPAGPPDPALCDADGYPYYHLSQKKNF